MAQEQGYLIQVSDDGINWVDLATASANATSYIHSALDPLITKHYRIKAKGDGVNTSDSDFSDVVQATTPSAGDTTPPIRQSIAVNALRPNVIRITYSDVNELRENVISINVFSVSGVASNPTIQAVIIYGSEKAVEVVLSDSVIESDSPLLSYSGSSIEDTADNVAATFTNETVSNFVAVAPDFSPDYELLQNLFNGGFTGNLVEDDTSNNNDGSLVKSHCLNSNGDLVLTFDDLTGVLVSSNGGTATVTKNGNTLEIGSGTLYNLQLDNGKILPISEGNGASVNSVDGVFNATLSGTINWDLQNDYHFNLLNGFSFLGDCRNGGYAQPSQVGSAAGAFDFEIKFLPLEVTSHDLCGTSNTAGYLEISETQVRLRLLSSTSQFMDHGGYNANEFQTVRVTRDSADEVVVRFNGTEIGRFTDSATFICSFIGKTSTSTGSTNMLVAYAGYYSAETVEINGLFYRPENNFDNATFNAGFQVLKFPQPFGGSKLNPSGNFHNGSETLIKPNPTGNAAIQSASGFTSATELSYNDLENVSNPVFCNTSVAKQYRSFITYDSVLPYEEELQVKNYVNENEQFVNSLSGFSEANYFEIANSDDIQANDTDFTVGVLVDPQGLSSGDGLLVGKTNKIDETGEGWWLSQNAGVITFNMRDGANNVITSRDIAFWEKDLKLSLILASVKDGKIYISKNGVVENTVIDVTGVTTTTQSTKIGSLSLAGTGYSGGIAAVYISGTKGFSIEEHEAFYQEVRNNAYTKTSMDLVFGGDLGNSSMVDRVSGSVNAVKNGTITATSTPQEFNPRYRPEDYQGIDNVIAPEIANTAGLLDLMVTGDSITDSLLGTGQNYADGIATLLSGSADMDETNMVGANGTAPNNHRGFSGSTVDTQMSSTGNVTVNWQTDLQNFDPDLITIRLGINATTSEVLTDRDIDDWETFLLQVTQYVTNQDVRVGVFSLLEHDDAFRRARAEYINYKLATDIVPRWGQKITMTFKDTYRVLKHQDGDFADVVHPNDAGYDKLIPGDYELMRNIAGKN